MKIVQEHPYKLSPRILLLIGFSFLLNFQTKAENISYKHDYDSLLKIVDECKADTCRFQILYGFYWNYAFTDFERVKPIGKWAYEEIKNSKNLKLYTDGLDILGCIMENEKNYDSANVIFQKTLSIAKKTGYHDREGWSYYHLALNNRNLGNNDSALYYYRTIYNFDSNGGNPNDQCDLITEIAWYFSELSQPDSAKIYFDKALELSRQIENVNKEIYTYIDLAWFYGKYNKPGKRVENLNAALILSEKSNDNKAIQNVYVSIANLFFTQKRNYDLALLYYSKALEKCPDEYDAEKASLHNEIANVYIAKGMDSLALKHALISFSLAHSVNHKHQISESHKTLGLIYSMQGKLLKAIDNYVSCYRTGCDKCPQIKFHNALIQTADAYIKMGDFEKAFEYYNKSLQLANDFKSPADQAQSMLKLGNFYRLSDSKRSEKSYLKAFQYARSSIDIIILKDIADTLTSFYTKNRNYKTAFEYQSIARSMGDSIIKTEQLATLAEWETRFEFEKLAAENKAKEKISTEEIKRQKIYRNSALLVSVLLMILGWVIWKSFRRKKKDFILLSEKSKEIENISNELHNSDEMKLRFFANLSHEFRTPLTLILNPAKNLLETMPLNGEYKKQVEYIYTNAEKLHNLTNQIMDLQKLDSGKLQLNNETDDIIEFCAGLVSSFESLCDSKNLMINFNSNYKSVIGLFDKDKTGKIITNLLSNAIKFSFEETTIDVKIFISSNRFNLSVSDKGIGIPANEVNNVYKRYFQATTNTIAEGTGIGLAYVKELVAFMHGLVTIDSVENKGTSINVTFPVEIMKIQDETNFNLEISPFTKILPAKEFDMSEFYDESNDKELILLVEDNDELRSYISKLFNSNYRVLLAGNGEEGIQTAIKYVPDIIISDVMMPGANGFELCTSLKNDEHTSHIPILLLTAKDNSQSSLDGYHSGADDYIIKPFDSELLKLKVRNILNTRAAISKQFNSESNTLPNSGSYSDIDKNFMNKCIGIIQKNLDNSHFSVDDLASELAFSRSNLYRKVLSLTTYNPAELIRNIRMQYAAQLLKTTQLRINEVAMEVGYDNTVKFSQAFKKHHGVLPSQIQ